MAVHTPGIREKLFFLFSGALISTPFPILVNSLLGYFLIFNFPPFYATFISVALVAPVIEEFAKAYPLFYRHGETERSIFTLGFLTGLGFGIAEFFLYVFLFEAPVAIRLPLILVHATNTAIVAYGIGRNRAFLFYLIAVGLHFLVNFAAQFGGAWIFVGLGAIVFSYALALYFYQRATEKTLDFWM